ncbi:hypothetical protein CMQ_3867 [Grosmannia clavigera kw1407]|uniref:Uncharacterized protein n=1 Tax=Grosmannia clavigera (strain kw1407 / UAMH 11150) TaxID=655863 RepID=F0XAT5_GROCL|nr:uncharacterized protein CMQ_3867 [Grosmannia clavigera kw1407]EFX05798.1 hypothetical protein CMQ_3867 [Grosmannia clavigera kw1407]
MPSSIPYDPSLSLGGVINIKALRVLEDISNEQAPVDAAQEHLNSLIMSKRSIDMTRTELSNLGIDTCDLDMEIERLNGEVQRSAVEYAKTKIRAEAKIKDLRGKVRTVHTQVESPVDFVKSQIKTMPLSADSLNMDVQYFTLDDNTQNAKSEATKAGAYASSISKFVAKSTCWMGGEASRQMSRSAQTQVHEQMSRHRIMGTLVISASCTHKNASIMAPLGLDVDKGIKVWNRLFPGDRLDVTNRRCMVDLAHQMPIVRPGGPCENKFSIISGMTFGSSLVGMVHILNSSTTNVSERLSSMVETLQGQMDAGAWFQRCNGGFGVTDTIANDVKSIISSHQVTSHVTMVSMGTIPSLVANEVKIGVDKFAQFDPKSSLEAIASIHNATAADQGTIKQAADAARIGQQMVTLKAGEIKAALTALSEIDDGANKMLDINSMMTALEDYLRKAAEGSAGVPLTYFLKDVTKDMLAELWVAKYFPGEYLVICCDDDDRHERGKDRGRNTHLLGSSSTAAAASATASSSSSSGPTQGNGNYRFSAGAGAAATALGGEVLMRE